MRHILPALAVVSLLAPPLAAQDPSVTVDLAIGREVVDRMPVDTASAFPANVGRLVAWTRVTGAAGTTMRHVWIHGENEFPVELEIGDSPWRTWSTKEIPAEWTGTWRVEVRDAAGAVLASAEVTVGG